MKAKRIGKKGLSIVLSLIILLTSCSVVLRVVAAEKEVNINIELLESVLNDRSWIVDTLVEGDHSGNPYAVSNLSSDDISIMDEVIDSYLENDSFAFLVTAMELYENKGEYLSGAANSVLSLFIDEDNMHDWIASVDQLKYESLIKEVTKTNYTASWGETLFEESAKLETFRQQAEIIEKITKFQNALTKKNSQFHKREEKLLKDPVNAQFGYKLEIEDYAGLVMDSYAAEMTDYIGNALLMLKPGRKDELKAKQEGYDALSALATYQSTKIPQNTINAEKEFRDNMFDRTNNALQLMGQVLEIGEMTADYAVFLEALCAQKEMLIDTTTRIADFSDEPDMVIAFSNFTEAANAAADEKIMDCAHIQDLIRQETAVTDILSHFAKEAKSKILKIADKKLKNVGEEVVSSVFSDASDIIELGVWLGDKATGIKDTSKKIYLCIYLKSIISTVARMCKQDIAVYNADKTDENAKKVLNDLQFLKQLRLCGEKIAQESIVSSMESWIGIIAGGNITKKYMDERLQCMTDNLLGCSFNPICTDVFEMEQDDTLTFLSKSINCRSYVEAVYTKEDGTTTYIAEADLKLMGGVDLNGATVNVVGASEGVYLSYIKNTVNGGKINIGCDNVSIGTIENTAELTVSIPDATAEFTITDTIINTGKLILNTYTDTYDSNPNIKLWNIKNSGTVSSVNMPLNTMGQVENNGTINACVNICGDGSFYRENPFYAFDSQAITGNGTFTRLSFSSANKKGTTILGTHMVTQWLSNQSSRIATGENLWVTGSCQVADNNFNGGLSFINYSLPQYLTVNGTSKIKGSVTFSNGVQINGDLIITEQADELVLNGETKVKGDYYHNGGIVSGSDWLDLYSDVYINTDTAQINKLRLSGGTQQSFTASNTLTITELYNNNLSLSGVTVNSKVYVTNLLQMGSLAHFEKGTNIILTGDAVFNYNSREGDISTENWNCNQNLIVKGKLNSSGALNIGDNFTVETDTFTGSGTLNIGDGAVFTSNDMYNSTSAVTNNGTIKLLNDSKIGGAFAGGSLYVYGDLVTSGTFTPDNLYFENKFLQSYTGSAATVKNLIIKNSSADGFNVGNTINVSESFTNNAKNIINEEKIVLSPTATYICNGESKGDTTVTGQLTIPAGETLVINGELNINSGAGIVIEDGAKLVVKKNLDINKGNIYVAPGSSLEIYDYLKVSGSTITADGDVIVKTDVKLTGSTLQGEGTFTFNGDLNTSSCTWNKPNIVFKSKLCQSVTGSAINVNNIKLENTSKDGITVGTTINYYGKYENLSEKVVGENKIVFKG